MTATTTSRTPSFVGIVLAAGEGERMGGPKALLAVRWGDGTGELPLAIAHARALLDGGAERVVIVTRASAARELSRFSQKGLDIIASNAEASLGPSGSLGVALRYLEAQAAAEEAQPVVVWQSASRGPLYLVTPVDTPPSSSSIRTALWDALDANRTKVAARPTFEGKRGHPVLIAEDALEPMKSATPPPLRDLLRDLGDACVDVPVVDARATVDLDTPADVEGWYRTKVRFFSSEEA